MDVVLHLRHAIQTALKAGEKDRAAVLRLLLSAVKQQQIDTGTPVDEAGLVAIVQKMIKQRRESIVHFEKAGREDLRQAEEREITLLRPFMPPELSEAELAATIKEAIAASGAATPKDMGKVMAILKPRLAGRADMSAVSALVKHHLTPP